MEASAERKRLTDNLKRRIENLAPSTRSPKRESHQNYYFMYLFLIICAGV